MGWSQWSPAGCCRSVTLGGQVGVVVSIVALAFTSLAPPAQAYDRHEGRFLIRLTGSEVPPNELGGGDPDGRGLARLALDLDKESVCFNLSWHRLDGSVTAAHIHQAPRGSTGPHHIDLFNDADLPGRRHKLSDCVAVESGAHSSPLTAKEKIQAVIDSPDQYYLNVHSTAFPPGAIRGQLD